MVNKKIFCDMNLSPETCRAELQRLIKEKNCCILLVIYIVVLPVDISFTFQFIVTITYNILLTVVINLYRSLYFPFIFPLSLS